MSKTNPANNKTGLIDQDAMIAVADKAWVIMEQLEGLNIGEKQMVLAMLQHLFLLQVIESWAQLTSEQEE
jgi:hypothetical protein